MENNQFNIRYREAEKRVKKIKGFYIHLMVYLSFNVFVIAAKALTVAQNERFWDLDLLKLPLLWGIGLCIHGLTVFLPSFIFGSQWEEKKIKELMDKHDKQP